MAVLSKHGSETLRVEQLKRVISIRSTGEVLVNYGTGWKMAEYREGKTAADFIRYVRQTEGNLGPSFRAYRDAVIAEFPSITERWKFNLCVSMLGGDIDGVWSELQDLHRIEVDLDTLRRLDTLRLAAKFERDARKGVVSG